jgi:xylulokinase
LLLDTRNWEWNEEVAASFHIRKSALPSLVHASEIAGKVTREAARLTGLRAGTPVATGSGDGITTILGLGVVDDGEVGFTVGSAGVVGVASRRFPEDLHHRNYVFCHPLAGQWYSVMATAASGEVFKWYKTNIVRDRSMTYGDLDAEAARAPLGADGVVFLPYILGSRNPHSNPKAAGVFFGLRHRHNRDHLSRALMEGVLLELFDLFSAQREILETKGQAINSVKISGGIVRSEFWTQMLADVLGMNVTLTGEKELGALGCAIMAATSVGRYRTVRDAVDAMVRNQDVVSFHKERHELYLERFEVFRDLYARLASPFNRRVETASG